MKKTYTQAELYAAEEACKLVHHKLGIRKERNAATHTDYVRAEKTAKHLDKVRAGIK